MPQPSERCLSRKAGIVQYCLKNNEGGSPSLRSAQKNWAGRVFYWEIKGKRNNKKRKISNRDRGPI